VLRFQANPVRKPFKFQVILVHEQPDNVGSRSPDAKTGLLIHGYHLSPVILVGAPPFVTSSNFSVRLTGVAGSRYG
jgi:hypothetical protein